MVHCDSITFWFFNPFPHITILPCLHVTFYCVIIENHSYIYTQGCAVEYSYLYVLLMSRTMYFVPTDQRSHSWASQSPCTSLGAIRLWWVWCRIINQWATEGKWMCLCWQPRPKAAVPRRTHCGCMGSWRNCKKKCSMTVLLMYIYNYITAGVAIKWLHECGCSHSPICS